MLLFFFNDTATTEIYTLSLHDALPISRRLRRVDEKVGSLVLLDVNGRVAQLLLDLADEAGSTRITRRLTHHTIAQIDRKSTRLNSSHSQISYAVFCLKKKNKYNTLVTY